jgi:crossover junction endodeoxyribonuclease RuvC
MNYCGIDVGFSGAISVLNDDGEILLMTDMPIITVGKKRELNEPKIRMILDGFKPLCVGIEKAQTMPNQGISSSGRYMASYGFLRGLCVGLSVEYQLIHPKTWKKELMHDMPKEKEASIMRVGQLYPDLVLGRKKDHGIADAILIAKYLMSVKNV